MKLRSLFVLLLSGTLLLTLLGSTPISAQWRGIRSPGQMALRSLGQGFGPGYHWKNPGPNSDYYNPYTAHNSMLISQMDFQSQPSLSLEGHPLYQSAHPGISESRFSPANPSGGDFQPPPQPANSIDADSSENNGSDDGNADSNQSSETRKPAAEPSTPDSASTRNWSNGKTSPRPVGYSTPPPVKF